MKSKITSLAIAVLAFIAMFWLGRAVGQVPDPGWMMFSETLWVNHATALAATLTYFGYPVVLAPICVALLVVAFFAPKWRWPIMCSIVAVLLAWQAADFLQHVFARPRRDDWIWKHETAFSYPSSHAAIATAFYLLWSVLVARSTLAYRSIIAVLLALIGFGIFWARLALGAHYLTDIVGGILLGISVAAMLAAVAPTNIFQGRGRPSLE